MSYDFEYDRIEKSLQNMLRERPNWVKILNRVFIEIHDQCVTGQLPLPVLDWWSVEEGDCTMVLEEGADHRSQQLLKEGLQLVNASCERCSNSAFVQTITGNRRRLCCWCYNQELEDQGVDTTDLIVQVVSPLFAEPLMIYRGWFDILKEGLSGLHMSMTREGFGIEKVEIKAMRPDRNGLKIELEDRLPIAVPFFQWIEEYTAAACRRCGHVGDVCRSKNADNHCSFCLHDYQ